MPPEIRNTEFKLFLSEEEWRVSSDETVCYLVAAYRKYFITSQENDCAPNKNVGYRNVRLGLHLDFISSQEESVSQEQVRSNGRRRVITMMAASPIKMILPSLCFLFNASSTIFLPLDSDMLAM